MTEYELKVPECQIPAKIQSFVCRKLCGTSIHPNWGTMSFFMLFQNPWLFLWKQT